jgi:hypothetical protein
MIFKVILNGCNMSVAMAFNVLELHWKDTVITSSCKGKSNVLKLHSENTGITQRCNNSYNISYFKLHVLEQ